MAAEPFDTFHDYLVGAWVATHLVFENEDYELPDVPAAFVYVEFVGEQLQQESAGAPGANMWLETGFAYMHVMAPSGTGTSMARGHARQLSNLFREQVLDGLYHDDMSIGEGRPERSFPNYWPMTVSVRWHRRDITGQ